MIPNHLENAIGGIDEIIAFATLAVHPFRDLRDDEGNLLQSLICTPEEAEYWCLYGANDDGHGGTSEDWIASYHTEADALAAKEGYAERMNAPVTVDVNRQFPFVSFSVADVREKVRERKADDSDTEEDAALECSTDEQIYAALEYAWSHDKEVWRGDYAELDIEALAGIVIGLMPAGDVSPA